MSLFDAIGRLLAGPTNKPAQSPMTPSETRVPEVAVADLLAELRSGAAPFVLDCRENYERRLGYIPGSVHIAMREVPQHLARLDRAADIVVACAHGNRSYSVAGYLIENGFRARSLRGGFADWQARGGEVHRD